MDVFDPYEERGVENPHALIEDEVPRTFVPGHATQDLYDGDPSKTEKQRWNKERRARARKRIVPGFYRGAVAAEDGAER